jgi:hypothetical protein
VAEINFVFKEARMPETSAVMEKPVKPKAVIIAVRLLYASIAVGFLRGLIIGPGLSKDVPMASVVLFLIFVSGIICFFVYKISRAKNWARIVYLLLFIIGNWLTILPLFRSVAVYPSIGLLGIGQGILELLAMVMLFLGPSNQWFKLSKKRKAL